MADIIRTLPCPLCPTMLTAIYEPAEHSGDTPRLALVTGCQHANQAMVEMAERSIEPLWESLYKEGENILLDQYADNLERTWRIRE